MNTLIVVLSESVIWYEYGMHRKPPFPPTVDTVRPEVRPVPGPGTDSSPGDSGEDSDDPFDTRVRDRGKSTNVVGPESVPQGFWMIKRKEWKTCYNPTGESALGYASFSQQEKERD